MKYIIKIICLTLIILTSLGCSESKIIESNYASQITQILSLAGKEHNKGLELIYLELSQNKSEISKVKDLVKIIESSTQYFLENNSQEFIINNKQLSVEYALSEIEKINSWVGSTNKARLTGRTNLWDDESELKLSSLQKELLGELNSAIDNPSLNLDQTLKRFEEVRNKAIMKCSDAELFPIISAIEIGKNSLTYWYYNSDDWQELTSPNANGRINGWFSWRSVGKADVQGAVGAAVAVGVVAAVSGPPGWAAGGAAVAGGAVGTSAADAVGQVFDRLF